MEVDPGAASSELVRYLTAKRSVDDRALNRHVLAALRSHVPVGEPGRPLRVLEIGAGNGTMVARVAEWELFRHADYLAIDAHADAVADAWRSLPRWAAGRGLACSERGTGRARALHIQSDRCELSIRLLQADVLD